MAAGCALLTLVPAAGRLALLVGAKSMHTTFGLTVVRVYAMGAVGPSADRFASLIGSPICVTAAGFAIAAGFANSHVAILCVTDAVRSSAERVRPAVATPRVVLTLGVQGPTTVRSTFFI